MYATKEEIREFALDTADKFTYLIKRLKRKARSKSLELSTLEEITEGLLAAYMELQEYMIKTGVKSNMRVTYTYAPSTYSGATSSGGVHF